MNSREKILKEIAQNKPEECPLPEMVTPIAKPVNLTEHFLEVLHNIGGKGKRVIGWHEPLYFLQQQLSGGVEVVNAIDKLAPYNVDNYLKSRPAEIEGVHTVFFKGSVAVAENAAIWLSEAAMVNRLLPFLCQHLVLVIEEKDIVANMHQAYEKIKVDEDGYGVFIAGPSKTADIEQSLVIGAHGPISLQVFILASIAE